MMRDQVWQRAGSLGLVVVLLIGAAYFFGLFDGEGEGASPSANPPVENSPVAPEKSVEKAAIESREWVPGEAAAASAAKDPKALPEVLRIQGVVLAAETGEPIPTAELKCRSLFPLVRGEPDPNREQTFACDAEGRFTFEIAPPFPPQFLLEVSAEGYGGQSNTINLDEFLRRDKPFQIALERGTRVNFLALDPSGAVVPGAALWVMPHPEDAWLNRVTEEWGRQTNPRLKTGLDGVSEPALHLVPGRWLIRSRSHTIVQGEVLVVPPKTERLVHDLRLKTLQTVQLRLRLVDDLNAPIAGVVVNAHYQAGDFFMDDQETDDAGRIVFETLAREPLSVAELTIESARHESDRPIELAFGEPEQEIQLKRRAQLRLKFEGDPPAPESLRLQVSDPALKGHPLTRTLAQASEGALAAFVDAGKWRIDLLPNLGTIEPPAPFAVDVQPGEVLERSLDLKPLGERLLSVRDERGEPVPASQVRVYHWRNRPPLWQYDKEAQPIHGPFVRLESQGAAIVDPAELVQVFEGKTDDLGQCRIRGSREPFNLVIVTGEAHLDLWADEITCEDGDPPLELEARAGATLFGRITPQSQFVALGLAPREDDPKHREKLRRYPPVIRLSQKSASGEKQVSKAPALEPDGSYRISGLLPGRYEISLFLNDRRLQGGAERIDHVILRLAEGLELREGQETTLETDLSAFAPAPVKGRIIIDGQPAAGARLALLGERFMPVGPPLRMGHHNWVTDEAGAFEGFVRPGTYFLHIDGGEDFDLGLRELVFPAPLTIPEPIVVKDSQPLEILRSLQTAALGVTVVGASGQPLVGALVRLVDAGDALVKDHAKAKTDAQGVAQFPRLVPGEKILSVTMGEDAESPVAETRVALKAPKTVIRITASGD